MIWIPTLIMSSAYGIIWFKLRDSFKAFPYLSEQSRIARSRRRVIRMLFVLILIELICWSPWQFFYVCEYIIYKFYRTSDNPNPEWWTNTVPILTDVRYYFIFFNSALNPLVYGYGNQTMQKAFRITFTCLFKDKVLLNSLRL